jgi:hypothetical protein
VKLSLVINPLVEKGFVGSKIIIRKIKIPDDEESFKIVMAVNLKLDSDYTRIGKKNKNNSALCNVVSFVK